MKTSIRGSFFPRALAVASLAIIGLPVVANANFSGPYNVSNWTLQTTGGSSNGSVDTSGAPNSITLSGGDVFKGFPVSGTTNFTIAAAAAGQVSFHFSYSTFDFPGNDPANFLLNGVTTLLAQDNGSTGSVSFSVNKGDIFGFQIFSSDDTGGPGVLTVSNFSGPLASVPDTGSAFGLLFLSLLALLGATSLRHFRLA